MISPEQQVVIDQLKGLTFDQTLVDEVGKFTKHVIQKARIFESYEHKKASVWEKRDFPTIVKNTYDGLFAEYYLVKHLGFKTDPHKWKDLVSTNGVKTEVKTFAPGGKQKHIKQLTEKRKTKYSFVIMFERTGKSYRFDSAWSYIDGEYEEIYVD
jgi:hypothetical protein